MCLLLWQPPATDMWAPNRGMAGLSLERENRQDTTEPTKAGSAVGDRFGTARPSLLRLQQPQPDRQRVAEHLALLLLFQLRHLLDHAHPMFRHALAAQRGQHTAPMAVVHVQGGAGRCGGPAAPGRTPSPAARSGCPARSRGSRPASAPPSADAPPRSAARRSAPAPPAASATRSRRSASGCASAASAARRPAPPSPSRRSAPGWPRPATFPPARSGSA